MRNGDFTQLGTALYDPYTTDPQTAQRQLLNPANQYVIPANRINPVGQSLVDLFPPPNLPGSFNNFVFTPKQVTNATSTMPASTTAFRITTTCLGIRRFKM